MKSDFVVRNAITDEWYTHARDVRLIIPYLVQNNYKKILCPFDTEKSNFVKQLKMFGFDVTYSHIDTGIDFFNIDDFYNYDCVVSNPPFSKRDLILERLFSVNIPFALLQNINGLFDSKKRFELMKNNVFELLIIKGRVKYFNETRKSNSPTFQSIYLCSNVLKNKIEFIDPDQFDFDFYA